MQPLRTLLVENLRTFQNGAGVVTIAPFQATNYILDGAGLVTLVTKKNGGDARSGRVRLSGAL